MLFRKLLFFTIAAITYAAALPQGCSSDELCKADPNGWTRAQCCKYIEYVEGRTMCIGPAPSESTPYSISSSALTMAISSPSKWEMPQR